MSSNGYSPWLALLIGIFLVFNGLRALFTGEPGTFRDVPLADWAGLAFVPLGIIMIILSIRSIRTWKEPEPPTYTDDDIRQAKEKLEQMHLREHGGLPEAPKPEAPKLEAVKLEAVKPETPDKGK